MISFVSLTFLLLLSVQTLFIVPLNGQKGLACWRGVTVQRGREVEEERETVECQAEKTQCGRSRCTFGALQTVEQRTYKDCVSSCDELRTHCEQNNGTYMECNICSLDKCNFEDYPTAADFMRQSQENGAAESGQNGRKGTAEKGDDREVGVARGDGNWAIATVGQSGICGGIGTIFAVLTAFY